jgi:hypothetical protein
MAESNSNPIASAKSPARNKAAETRQRRRQEREARAWLGRISVLVDGDPNSDLYLPTSFEIVDGDAGGAIRKAITAICEAMAPLAAEEITRERAAGVEDPRPLEQDVALAHAGKIVVAIQATDEGPLVRWLRSAAPGHPE